MSAQGHSDVDLECATALVDRVKLNVLEQVGDIRERVILIKQIYADCVAIPSEAESYACLRGFALEFIEQGRNLLPEVIARRENTTLYALERLIDYHECRLAQHPDPNAISTLDARETYCAIIVIEEVSYRFEAWFEQAETTWARLVYRFIECSLGPEDRQPRCFLNLAEDARAIIESTIVALGDRREFIINAVDSVLNSYHECRKV